MEAGRCVIGRPVEGEAVRNSRKSLDDGALPSARGGRDLAELARRYPELDWSDPDGAVETLEILNDPEAMADLGAAENDMKTGKLMPLHLYAVSD